MKQFTLGGYTLDDFADYLNGNNNFFEGIEGNTLLLTGENKLTKTINMHCPLTITGDKATIVGANQGDMFAFSMTASDTTVSNLAIRGFRYGVDIDAMGKLAENIKVVNVVMYEGVSLIDCGSSVSNSTLRGVFIEGCDAVVGSEQPEEYEYAEFSLSYNFLCARYKGGGHIDNCLLENVHVNNCKKTGFSRTAITFMSAMPVGTNYTMTDMSYSNLVMKDIFITNNHLDTCWDCGMAVTGAFINTGAITIDGVTIDGNYCDHGIGAVLVVSGAHHFGNEGGSVIKNVKIRNNHLVKKVADVGEPVRGIWLMASRGDYYPGISSHDYSIDNVEISSNKLEGSGVVVTGAYAFLDGDQTHTNNVVSNVNIHDNQFLSVDCPFVFDGAEAEGRLHDWNFGCPPHTKDWGAPIVDDSLVTYKMTGNCVKNLTVVDNTIEGYRYRVTASGAWGHGHGICTDNKVVENIVFANNHFGVGENHIHVSDLRVDDFVTDGGGNSVSDVFKK